MRVQQGGSLSKKVEKSQQSKGNEDNFQPPIFFAHKEPPVGFRHRFVRYRAEKVLNLTQVYLCVSCATYLLRMGF